MQAQFSSKKGERFDACYGPRGWDAILISDTHALSCSFVSTRGFAAREMCSMRLFWTRLELTAAPAARGSAAPAQSPHSPRGGGGDALLREAGGSAREGLIPTREPGHDAQAHKASHTGRLQREGPTSEQTPCTPQNRPARTHLSLQVSDPLLELLDHGVFGLNHRFGVLEL